MAAKKADTGRKIRLAEELERIFGTASRAAWARGIGVNRQTLANYVDGETAVSCDVIASVMVNGGDAKYILTGVRSLKSGHGPTASQMSATGEIGGCMEVVCRHLVELRKRVVEGEQALAYLNRIHREVEESDEKAKSLLLGLLADDLQGQPADVVVDRVLGYARQAE